jgi:hypothetical protein
VVDNLPVRAMRNSVLKIVQDAVDNLPVHGGGVMHKLTDFVDGKWNVGAC